MAPESLEEMRARVRRLLAFKNFSMCYETAAALADRLVSEVLMLWERNPRAPRDVMLRSLVLLVVGELAVAFERGAQAG